MSILIFYSKIQEAKHQSLLEHNKSFFCKKYQRKLFRYRRWQDAQLSLLGRLLVKEGMAYLNKEVSLKELEFTKYNKPYFKNNRIHFNISHSGEIVVVSITNKGKSIGVDIEKNHHIKIEYFKNQMTQNEQQTVFNSDDSLDAFFIYWTQKEAVIKAHGKGLSIPLKSFEIKNNNTRIDNDVFYVSKIELEKGYTCHIASQNKFNKKDMIIEKINTNRFITT